MSPKRQTKNIPETSQRPHPDASFDAVVIGAGVAGLSAAHELAKHQQKVLLLEREHRVGGVIHSESHKGFLLELGPNSYSSFGEEETQLLREIGLEQRALRKPLKTTHRYIWHSGTLHRVPTGLGSFLVSPILSWGAKLQLAIALLRKPIAPTQTSSLGGWMRNLAGDEFVETLLKPFFGGIYAADVDRSSFVDCFPSLYNALQKADRLSQIPRFLKKEREHKERVSSPASKKGKSLTSFPKGLEELPKAMAQAFCSLGGEFHLGQQISILPADTDSGYLYRVVTDHGIIAHTNHVILALSHTGAASLIGQVAPKTSALLAALPSVPLNVVHVGVEKDSLKNKRKGFGFLTRRGEGIRILGSIWSSRIFPNRAPKGYELLTCFYGGQLDPEALDWDDSQIKRQVFHDLRKTMSFEPVEVKRPFRVFHVTRWRPALALYPLGHQKRLQQILEAVPEGIQLVGGYLGKPSLPDRIKAGKSAAAELLKKA
jgi:oxygen-dependent protoporphyrinogen oxidase